MISLQSVSAKNFLSFRSFRIPLSDWGVVALVGLNEDNTNFAQSNGCLAGETLIDCPRDLAKFPRGIPIKDLVGKRFWTYVWDGEKIVLGKVRKVWCNGKRKVVRIKVSTNGGSGDTFGGRYRPPRELVLTADHLVLTKKRGWVPAGELRRRDRIISLYRSHVDRGKLLWTNCGIKYGVREQQYVCSIIHGKRPKDCHVHHINGNRYDHRPENLQWVDASAHLSRHTSERNRKGLSGWKVSNRHPRGMLGKKHSKAICKQISAASIAMWDARGRKERISIPCLCGCGDWTKPGRRYIDGHQSRGSAPWRNKRNVSNVNHCVLSVESCGYRKVYDMEVPGFNNFVANGMVVHNSGKSSLWDAVVWCLYGKTLRGLTHDAVINKSAGKDCMVTVNLDKNGTHFAVRRFRGHSDHKNQVWVGDDSGWREQATTVRTQEVIEMILGLDYSRFVSMFAFSQSIVRQFASSSDTERKALLERTIPMIGRCKEAVKQVREDIKQKELICHEAKLNYDHNKEKISELKQKYTENEKALATERKSKKDQIRKIEKKLSGLKKELKTHKAELSKCTKKREEYESSLEKLEKREGRLEKQKSGLDREIAVLEKQHSQYCYLEQNGQCEVCGTEVDTDKIASKKKVLNAKIVSSNGELWDLGIDLGHVKDRVKKLERVISKLEQHELALRKKDIPRCEEDIESLEEDLEEVQKPLSLERVQEQIEKEIKACRASLKSDLATLETEEGDLAHLRFWDWGFGPRGLPSYLLDYLLDFLNSQSRVYMRMLFGGEVRLEFDTESELKSGDKRDKLAMHVFTDQGELSYDALSGGERCRVDICLSFLLQKLFTLSFGIKESLNVLVIDEAMDALDAVGIQQAVQLIRKEAEDKSSVFIVTHKSDLADYLSKQLVVRKRNGVSEVLT